MGKELVKIPNLNYMPVTIRFNEDGKFEIEYDGEYTEKFTHNQIINEVSLFLKESISNLD